MKEHGKVARNWTIAICGVAIYALAAIGLDHIARLTIASESAFRLFPNVFGGIFIGWYAVRSIGEMME